MIFEITQEQYKKINIWVSSLDHTKPLGAIGGRFTYMFTDTSLGTVVQVQDGCTGETLDVSDYEFW